ncbi:MAG: calcium-binding protein, partial [Verrucomicrobiota bacterium]
ETSDLFSTTYHGNRSTTKLRSAPDFTDNDGNNVVEGRFTVILGSQSDTLAYSATRNNDSLLEKIKVTDENYIFDSDEVEASNVDPDSYVTGIWGVKIDSAGATYAPFIDNDQDGQNFDNIGQELSMALTVSDLEYLVNKNGIVGMKGERFVIMEEYFSDRLTGTVETVHYAIRLNGDYWDQFETSVEVKSLTFGYAKDNIGNTSITINGATYSENEKLRGTNKDDLIFAQFGDDDVNGKNGDDILYGGFGDDKLNGGKGNDILIAGGGSDVLNGGSGTDTAVMQGRIDDYTITQTGAKSYTISSSLWLDGENVLKNIEYIQFNGDALLTDPSNSLNLSSYFSNLSGSEPELGAVLAGNNIVPGANNDDIVMSGGKADIIYALEGNDVTLIWCR